MVEDEEDELSRRLLLWVDNIPSNEFINISHIEFFHDFKVNDNCGIVRLDMKDIIGVINGNLFGWWFDSIGNSIGNSVFNKFKPRCSDSKREEFVVEASWPVTNEKVWSNKLGKMLDKQRKVMMDKWIMTVLLGGLDGEEDCGEDEDADDVVDVFKFDNFNS